MYEIKKNDYNTVRFLPEYNSGFGNDFQHRQNRKKKQRRAALILVIAILIIAAAAFTVYKTFFSPADKFTRAFDSSDFDICREIFAANAYDDGFVSEVKDSVTSSATAAYDRYTKGELSSTDAATLLKNYNDASCEDFAYCRSFHFLWSGGASLFVSAGSVAGLIGIRLFLCRGSGLSGFPRGGIGTDVAVGNFFECGLFVGKIFISAELQHIFADLCDVVKISAVVCLCDIVECLRLEIIIVIEDRS